MIVLCWCKPTIIHHHKYILSSLLHWNGGASMQHPPNSSHLRTVTQNTHQFLLVKNKMHEMVSWFHISHQIKTTHIDYRSLDQSPVASQAQAMRISSVLFDYLPYAVNACCSCTYSISFLLGCRICSTNFNHQSFSPHFHAGKSCPIRFYKPQFINITLLPASPIS